MKCTERGFTLVESIVTIGIVAMLLAAGGVWLLGMHPGALTQATSDYDAAIASARGFAETGGNGATLVFAPRPGGVPGFTLRAYSGRPSAAGAVQPTTAMPVVSDATIAEATLGNPPFSVFIGASGHVSGQAAYPSIDANGNATFPAIAAEPACPSRGFVLTFTGPQGAVATRTLPCTPSAATAPGSPGPPNPSPTPNVPLLTPATLVYHWPADAEQSFVATEWGYTHWFASTTGFTCGASVATYPDILPKPYSPPHDRAEGEATPPPPAGEPFSYPNSDGASMNDAPALFRLDPNAEGLCKPTIGDDYAQVAKGDVQVMGWLTAAYKGKAYTHLTSPPLTLPSTALPKDGASVTLAVSKTYDTEALQLAVALDGACSQYVTIATAAGTTPGKPSAAAATASITLTLVSLPKSPISCGGVIYDQYRGSQIGEGVPFNATIAPESPLSAWPPAEQVGAGGASIGTVAYANNDPAEWLNRLAGGTDALAATKPCLARAYSSTSFDTPLSSVSFNDAGGKLILQTDSGGCILDGVGTPISGAAVATEPGYVGDFGYQPGDCQEYITFTPSWTPGANGPGSSRIGISGTKVTTTPCTFEIIGDTNPPTGAPTQTPAPVSVSVLACTATEPTVTAPTGVPCEIKLPANSGIEPCISGDEQPPYPTLTKYFASFSNIVGHDLGMTPVTTSSYGSISDANVGATFTRSSPGSVNVYIIQEIETAHRVGNLPPDGGCAPDFESSVFSTVTFN